MPWRPYPAKRMPRARPTSQWEKACSEKYASKRLKTIQRAQPVPCRPAGHASVAAPSIPPTWTALPWATERVSQGSTRPVVGMCVLLRAGGRHVEPTHSTPGSRRRLVEPEAPIHNTRGACPWAEPAVRYLSGARSDHSRMFSSPGLASSSHPPDSTFSLATRAEARRGGTCSGGSDLWGANPLKIVCSAKTLKTLRPFLRRDLPDAAPSFYALARFARNRTR